MSASILNPVTLGMTGLEVSRVAFGTWQLGGEWGRFDEDEGIPAIRRARELGVNQLRPGGSRQSRTAMQTTT